MCGRFAYAVPTDKNQLAFPKFIFPDNMPRRYNIAPGQNIAAISNTAEGRADLFKWGLVPSWSKDPKIGNKMINARGETLAEKPSFRAAFRRKRCLIPATGFYEWQRNADGKTKTPMHIELKSGAPFAMAGLWESWVSPEGGYLQTCTIITTQPNSLMAPIHNRMPVILSSEDYEIWLVLDERRDLQHLLKPYPKDKMQAHPVSTLVNSPANNSPDCLKPVQLPEQSALFCHPTPLKRGENPVNKSQFN